MESKKQIIDYLKSRVEELQISDEDEFIFTSDDEITIGKYVDVLNTEISILEKEEEDG